MTTNITELAQSLKRRAASANEFGEGLFFIKADDVLALVEALASEKRICATWRKTAESTGEKLEKAQAVNAAAEKLVRCKGRYHSEQNYRALAALFGVNTPDLPPLEHENVHYVDAAEMEIAALRQRIAELESRTVKLPKRFCPEEYEGSLLWSETEVWNQAISACNGALRTAGIKVEDE
ncbi:ead/Ea22-like family protein [Klebsiella pneumoniae]